MQIVIKTSAATLDFYVQDLFAWANSVMAAQLA
jgi:hypothetical protein